MDWVEKKAMQEQALRKNARGFWDAFRVACEEAVKSHRRYYAMQISPTFTAAGDNAFFINVERELGTIMPLTHSYKLVFDPAQCTISIDDGNKRPKVLQLDINFGGMLYVLMNGHQCNPSELCQMLLEPILFPASTSRDLPKEE